MKPYKSAIPDYDRLIAGPQLRHELGDLLAKREALTSGDLEKYEFLTGDHSILPTQAHQEISKKLFSFTPLSAKFDEQTNIVKENIKEQEKFRKDMEKYYQHCLVLFKRCLTTNTTPALLDKPKPTDKIGEYSLSTAAEKIRQMGNIPSPAGTKIMP